MTVNNPACEHCGHTFDPHKTVKGPVICPACGLTAHPFGKQISSAAPTAYNEPTPLHRTRLTVISGLIMLCIIFVSGLVFNFILLQRIDLVQKDQARIFAMLAELQVDVQPNAATSAQAETTEAIDSYTDTKTKEENVRALNVEENRFYKQLEQRLERNYPLIPINSEVKLRQNNGQIVRGTYVGMKDDAVLLLQNGQIRDIKTVLLDRESRLGIDPVFREKVIQLQMKKTNIEQGKRQN